MPPKGNLNADLVTVPERPSLNHPSVLAQCSTHSESLLVYCIDPAILRRIEDAQETSGVCPTRPSYTGRTALPVIVCQAEVSSPAEPRTTSSMMTTRNARVIDQIQPEIPMACAQIPSHPLPSHPPPFVARNRNQCRSWIYCYVVIRNAGKPTQTKMKWWWW